MSLYSEKVMPKKDRIYKLIISNIEKFDIRVINNFNDLGSLKKENLENISDKYASSNEKYHDGFSYQFDDFNDKVSQYYISTEKIENNLVNKMTLVKYIGNGIFEDLASNSKILIRLETNLDIENEFTTEEDQKEAKNVEEIYNRKIIPDKNRTSELYNLANKLLDTPLVIDYKSSSIFDVDKNLLSKKDILISDNLKEYMKELNNKAMESLKKQIDLIPIQDEYLAHVENVQKKVKEL